MVGALEGGSGGEIVAEGPIWEGVVPGVLRGLYVGRRTGTLTFFKDGERRGVHVHHGEIVNADTSVREDRLGPVLVREGRLTEADRKRAEGFAVRDGRRLGAVLLDLGLLDRAGLQDALALHVDAVLSKVFAWTDGRYEFRQYEELPLPENDVTLRVSTGDLILQAAHSVQDPDVVRYNLGDMKRVLVASSDPLLRFQRIRLSPIDGYLMSRVDGLLSAREVIQLIPLPVEEVERSLFGLVSTGIVEFLAPPEPARDSRKAPPAAVEPAGAAAAQPSASAPASEPTVILDLPRFDEQPAVDPTVILSDRVLATPPPADATVVFDGSFEPLPAAELRRRETLELHQGLKARSHFELLGIPRDATEAQVREAYFRLAKRFHPDGQHEAGLVGLRDALEAIFRRLGEAYETLRNPRFRAAYERSIDAGASAATVESAAITPDAEALLDPEALLARGSDLLEADRQAQAAEVLERALPRAEGALKQRCRILLARAYARTPDRVKQGEELLLAVVRDEPDSAEAHLQLGMIYRGQGLRSRALTAFRRVLELEPGHAEARRLVAERQ